MPTTSPRDRWRNLMRAWIPFKMQNAVRGRQSSTASDETIDIPREFPPPTHRSHVQASYPIRTRRRTSLSSSESTISMAETSNPKGENRVIGESYASTTFKHKIERPEDKNGSHDYVHWCRDCQRPRSRRYHRANPSKPGEKSVPGVCSRCMPIDQLDGRRSPSPPVYLYSDKSGTEEIIIRDNRPFSKNTPRTIRIIRHRYTSPERTIRPKAIVPVAEEHIAVRGRQQNPPHPEPSFDLDHKHDRYRVRVSVSPVYRRRTADEIQRFTKERVTYPHQTEHEYTHVDDVIPEMLPRLSANRVSGNYNERANYSEERFSGPERRIASHSQPWSYVRMPPPNEELPYRREAYIDQPPTPPREPSPPEWFYRSRVRVLNPSGSHRGYSPPAHIQHSSRGPPDGSANRFSAPVPPKAVPLGGALPRSRSSMPQDCYDEAKIRTRRTYRYPAYSSEDDEPPRNSGRVRFAPTLDREKAKQHDIQAKRDDREAQRDRTTFEDTKEKIRKTVSKGGGRYEVDGANDMEYYSFQPHEQAGTHTGSDILAPLWSLQQDRPTSPTTSAEVNVDDSLRLNAYNRHGH